MTHEYCSVVSVGSSGVCVCVCVGCWWFRPRVGTRPPCWRVPEQSAASLPAPGTVTPGLWGLWCGQEELLWTFFFFFFGGDALRRLLSLRSTQVTESPPSSTQHPAFTKTAAQDRHLTFELLFGLIRSNSSHISGFDAPFVSKNKTCSPSPLLSPGESCSRRSPQASVNVEFH